MKKSGKKDADAFRATSSKPTNHCVPPSLAAVLEKISSAPEAEKLLSSWKKGTPITWNEVAPPAIGFVCALLASTSPRPVCFICQDARAQEKIGDDLLAWSPAGAIFPELAMAVIEGALPDPETLAERFAVLCGMASASPPPWVLFSLHQLDEPMPPPEAVSRKTLTLAVGQETAPESIQETLSSWNYEAVPQVFHRGQVARRGGILDVYSWQSPLPFRIEFFDTVIESIRSFDPEQQLSVNRLESASILAPPSPTKKTGISSWTEGFSLVYIDAKPLLHQEVSSISSSLDPDALQPLAFREFSGATFSAGDFLMDEIRRRSFFEAVSNWLNDGWTVALFCDNEGEHERFSELARDNGIDASGVLPCCGNQANSFVCPGAKLAVLTDSDIFGRSTIHRIRRLATRRDGLLAARAADDLAAFSEGDFVVHAEHGIAVFHGVQKIAGVSGSVLVLEFAGDARLYVPEEDAWQISRYIGLGKKHPELSSLGSEKWDKAKSKTSQAIFLYAKQMLRLQAERETSSGFAFLADNHWQKDFENAFPFQETPDQAKAIHATKTDMEDSRPMDRLICGDVGFGKTEVAIRAAFKAVMGGKQAAFLAPTTVLAQQHFQTLKERMSEYPVRIEILNRYRTASEQLAIVRDLAAGSIDILVGTHRIISNDVIWKDLGLLIVDEEQRFGVKQKDLLKERFRTVDVLTLSATPIPRTLYLALMGARDMSVIETPPPNRQPVETLICGYDERIIRDAIRKEIERGGQVYLLHNRVATIEKLASRVRDLVPEARVEHGHGQMEQGELEDVMERFVGGKTDVLVSTTIIESGLDIPNANTIIIDRADMFGLADLYQLRGRVGRSGTKAYAYLLIPRSLVSAGGAQKRIAAIQQYSKLGSGFKIAMRDLEIRGAGNILGTAQSGHIITVGFDLYCKMLRSAVKKIQGDQNAEKKWSFLQLDFLCTSEGESVSSPAQKIHAFFPSSFVQAPQTRIEAYRKLNEADSPSDLDRLASEWKDRFGPLPAAAKNLLLSSKIRMEGGSRKISRIETKEEKLILVRKGDYILLGTKFPRLKSTMPEAKLQEILAFVRSL